MSIVIPTILEQIVLDTKDLIEVRKKAVSLGELRDSELFGRTCYSLEESLASRTFGIIAEAKKASPSQGIIRPDFDPIGIVSEYERHGAAAVSILTEPRHFKGDIRYLSECRPHVSIPILRKDFIIDPYQVEEAKSYGADAILLIATILERSQLSDLQHAAHELGLSVLVEVYSERELERVDVDNTPIIGANNRDLNTFEVSLHHAIQVLSSLPASTLRIAESGIHSVEDVILLREKGLNGALIGEAFMRQKNPGETLAQFIEATT